MFEPRVQTNRKPASKRFFFREVIVAFEFFQTVVSVISLEQKTEKTQAGLSVVGWCMISTVPKSHVQTRNIEPGMANLSLWQYLGRPSSYDNKARRSAAARYAPLQGRI